MGVRGGGKVLHKITGLSRGETANVVRGLAASRQAPPIVVVDCNNLMFAVQSKPKSAAEYLYDFAKCGITVLPAWDNNIRPSVKQETNRRRANREKARTEEYLLRREIRILKRRLNEEALTQQQRSDLLTEIKDTETKRKRKETSSYCPPIPDDAADEIERELDLLSAHSINEAGGSVLKVVTAQWQADSYMAGQIVNNNAVMVMSTDTDIPLLTGDCCISIKGFSKKNLELVSTSKATLQSAMAFVEADSKAKLVAAANPIFDGVADRRLRALMMLIPGCDVYYPGLKNVGIPTLSGIIDDFKKTVDDPQDESMLFKHLIGFMKKEFKPRLVDEINDIYLDESEAFADMEADEVVHSYLDALVYEPTNQAGEEITYLGSDAPPELSQYCAEFAAPGTQLSQGPSVMKCKGVGGKDHTFLAAAGYGNCAKCKHDVCIHCQTTIGTDTSTYCLLCAATESLVPEIGTDAAVSVESKRRTLIEKYSFAGADDLDSDDVEDALEMMEFLHQYRSQGSDVEFPLYATEEMDATTTTKWDDIAEIDFAKGGAFIADGTIDQKHILGILKFFAGVATFHSPDEKHTAWKKDSAIYDALPKLLIDFANKSRVDSGYRLLGRCLRHALDSKCPTLENKVATLILHGDDVGIRIHSPVPASMRKVVYNPGIVFTDTQVLCCKCNCHCGSEKKERIVCVHNFPLVFLLLLLLMDALAESILMEFAACWRSDIWDNTFWSEEEVNSMKQYIVTLAEAAGEDMSAIDLDVTIDDLMDKFETGTEGRKKWKQRSKLKPKPEDHCSIADIGSFESTATEAKKRTRRPTGRNAEENTDTASEEQEEGDVTMLPEDEGDAKTPNYMDMDLLINAAGFDDVLESNPIAWQLLKMRARKQRDNSAVDTRTILSKTNDLKARWEELLRLGSKRTHRSTTTADERCAKKPRRDPTASPPESSAVDCPPTPRVVTPTEFLPSNESPPIIADASIVTPSPKKRSQLRRPGCKLPSRPTPTAAAMKPQQHKKKEKISHRCCKFGCKNNNRDNPKTRFFCIPKYRKPLTSENPRKETLIRHAGAVLLRQEIMDRTMSDRYNVTTKGYVCEHHDFEEVSKSTAITLNNGDKMHVTYKLVVPSGAGPSTQSKTMSLGTGRDRGVRKILTKTFGKDDPTKKDVDWAMCAQAMAEESCPDQHRIPLNPSVAAAANIPSTTDNVSRYLHNGKLFRATPVTSTKTNRRRADELPVVQPGMSDSEVKRRTGIPSEMIMLAFIIVVCDGDIDKIKKRQTPLSWYEEWFMAFEYVWNRSVTRLVDVSKAFGDVHEEDVLRILDAKLDICWNSRKRWPMFASFEEDKTLQKEKWASRYDRMRPVMWDMTNVSAYGFTSAHWQSLTYSTYYGENCFKSGVFCQPCGWMGVVDLWTGGVSDSDFNRRAGYLKMQQQFQEKDLVTFDGELEPKEVPFLNIYDKGYRAKMAAWEHGKQRVLQPDFKDSDKRFNRDQTISSASVASDRGGNERVVNVSKRAGLISKGYLPNADPTRFNKIWTTWSFLANFIYDPVL